MTRFLITLSVVSLLVLAAVIAWIHPIPSFCYESLVLLYVSTGGLYYFIVKTREENPDYFVQIYLLSIAIKLLAYGAYLGVVIWKDQAGANYNVVFFMVTYVLFTALEVAFLVGRVRD